MVERVSIGTATTLYKLTEKEWITVGVGPLLLIASNPILYALSNEIPTETMNDGFVLQRGETLQLALTNRVWVCPRGEYADVYVAGPEEA